MRSICRVFLLVATFWISCISSANTQSEEVGCNDADVEIIFINGIWNIEDKASRSLEILRTLINNKVKQEGIDIGNYCVTKFYNPTASKSEDLLEAFVQSDEQIPLNGFLSAIINTANFFEIIKRNSVTTQVLSLNPRTYSLGKGLQTDLILSTNQLSEKEEETLNSLVTRLGANIIRGKETVLVAHSQGNYFANRAYDVAKAITDVSELLHIVSVATPDDTVRGSIAETELWTTNNADIITDIPRSKPGNTRTMKCYDTQQDRTIRGECHSWKLSYLAEGETRDKIFQHIVDRIKYVPPNNFDTLTRIFLEEYEATADRDSGVPRISGDGQIIAFVSSQRNYENSTSFPSLYMHDRATNVTELVERSANSPMSLSKDGRFIAYKRSGDVKVYDRQENTSTVEIESIFFNQQLLISQSGRYVAFDARKDSLFPGDTNNRYDVYVKDRETGELEIISDLGRADQTENVYLTDISPDGRYVVYHGTNSIRVYDRTLDVEMRVAPSGIINPTNATISDFGRYVVFEASNSNNLVNMNGYNFGSRTLYIHDLISDITQELTVDEFGTPANSTSFSPKISGDGRYVAFISDASNWVSDDTNGVEDIFVYDREELRAQRINVSNNGMQADTSGVNAFTLYNYVLNAKGIDISSDAIQVVFTSHSDSLDINDNNLHADVFVKYIAPSDQF